MVGYLVMPLGKNHYYIKAGYHEWKEKFTFSTTNITTFEFVLYLSLFPNIEFLKIKFQETKGLCLGWNKYLEKVKEMILEIFL